LAVLHQIVYGVELALEALVVALGVVGVAVEGFTRKRRRETFRLE
jgi:hypothetical protein